MRQAPKNKLSASEQAAILAVCNQPALPVCRPPKLYRLLDEGIYHGSESTFYRVLRQHEQLAHRGRALAPKASSAPKTFTATGPCQVFCWDITYLPSPVRGQFYYLYMIEDVYSRKIVGWEVYDHESGVLAAQLLERTLISENALHTGGATLRQWGTDESSNHAHESV
ncbi:DDE-type integrase/transposase/recombinase [Psychrobacter sp. JCM 18903]|uniref:DDE-type integrase/transposase/recombinase n=1 Tax=Psychrobacter sp. JCM 18903 TaxID=1298610 RepID=UPI0004B2D786|nr:DDE-type integrase/transposase/recombinase [Psychrobacter sp. JCM 18903]